MVRGATGDDPSAQRADPDVMIFRTRRTEDSPLSDKTWVMAPPPPPPAVTDVPPRRPRWGLRILAGFSVFLLVAGAATAGAYFGIRQERDHWQPLYRGAVRNVAHWRSESTRWQLKSQRFQDLFQTLQEDVSSSVGDLNSPHFLLWNDCGDGPDAGCALTPGQEWIGGVPDTFTYNLRFHADVPVTVWIYSSQNFVCHETRQCPANGIVWRDRTELDAVFHSAEGCASYIAVWSSTQPGTLYPSVSVTRNPAPNPTGVCAN
jgi:hypothetical protein